MKIETQVQRVISAAVAAAGRSTVVAEKLGVVPGAVRAWISRGSVPAQHIQRLCDLGGRVVTPEQITEAIANSKRGPAE
ncbi:MAG: putative antitoxin of bacterial toxin-antitoxin system, YdaS/YdaT [Pseudomonadota bacterium]|jgi:hypothetical protein